MELVKNDQSPPNDLVDAYKLVHVEARNIKLCNDYAAAGWCCVGVAKLLAQESALSIKTVAVDFLVFQGRVKITREEYLAATKRIEGDLKGDSPIVS